jgi:hypothetical protein
MMALPMPFVPPVTTISLFMITIQISKIVDTHAPFFKIFKHHYNDFQIFGCVALQI